MKESKKSSIIYAARQILANSTDKYIGIACAEPSLSAQKNFDTVELYRVLSEMGKKVLLVNFDPDFSADIELVDAVSCTEQHLYDVDKALAEEDISNYDKVLLNLCSIADKGYLLDKESLVKEIVLTVKYGKSTYRAFESATETIKQNDIKLIGVLAHSQSI